MGKICRTMLKWIGMLCVGSALTCFFLAYYGNRTQIYTDMIVGDLSQRGSNKSIEMFLLYGLCLVGMGILIAVAYFRRFLHGEEVNTYDLIETDHVYQCKKTENEIILVGILTISVMRMVVTGNVMRPATAILLAVALYWMRREYFALAMTLLGISLFSVSGFQTLAVFLGGEGFSRSTGEWLMAAMCAVAVVGSIFAKERWMEAGCLILQMWIPGLMLRFLLNQYDYKGSRMTIVIPVQVTILLAFCIVVCVIENLWRLLHWSRGGSISAGTCIAIVVFRNFTGTGNIMPTDMHHPFENILAFSQRFELGQKLFLEYVPASGLYSLVQGALFQWLGNGKLCYYYLTQNLFKLGIACWMVWVLRRLFGERIAFFLSILFYIPDYNRYYFLLPAMGTLMLPALIRRRNLWLKVYLFLAMFQGLYYPVCGVAFLLACFPLAIFQMRNLLHEKPYKGNTARKFWIGWVLCVIPVLLSLPVLWKEYEHIQAMSQAGLLSTGMARFGTMPRSDWIPYVSNLNLRVIYFYVASFMMLACPVWIATAVVLETVSTVKAVRRSAAVRILCSIMPCLLLLIGYLFTALPMDKWELCVRAESILTAAGILILYCTGFLPCAFKRKGITLVLFAVLALPQKVTLPSLQGGSDMIWEVPVEYIAVNEEEGKVGSGFMEQAQYMDLQQWRAVAAGLDRTKSYLGIYPRYGHYYLLETKGDSMIEMDYAQGREMYKKTTELLQKNQTIVGCFIDPYRNYLLYRWLVTSGQYIYLSEAKCFIPALPKTGWTAIEQANKNNPIAMELADWGNSPASFAKGMSGMSANFQKTKVTWKQEKEEECLRLFLEQPLWGNDADFVYLELEPPDPAPQYQLEDSFTVIIEEEEKSRFYSLRQKVYSVGSAAVVKWLDDTGQTHQMQCNLDEGKLLIPLGAGNGWLLNTHRSIEICIKNEKGMTAPDMVDIQFLYMKEP